MSALKTLIVGTALFATNLEAGGKLKLEQLPPAVRKTVEEQTKNATLVGLSKEMEKGKTMYEVETKVDGKSRDLILTADGAIDTVEEEVDFAVIPAAAKAAIEKKAAGGTIKKVETLTKGSMVSYEGSIKTKSGRNIEVGVNADGSAHQ